jgi:cell wall-associated NlpC family hydrolase
MLRKVLPTILLVVLFACDQPNKQGLEALQILNDSIKKSYAPDKRVAVYTLKLSEQVNQIQITGETDQPQALSSLMELLKARGMEIKNEAIILPDSSVGPWKQAVVNNSVANIRSKDKHSGELATQAILGTPLKVLKIQGDFYLVQTPDGYISWVDHGGVTLMSSEEFKSWQMATKVVFTKGFGYVYKELNNEFDKIGDMVLGSQLMLLEDMPFHYKVQYPDKREGYLKKSESEVYDAWIQEVQPSGELLELYAKELMGAPYLWGGTSSKGMDCSGFTKTVFLMNGYIIPRDASQQIMAGKDADPEFKLENLQKGDLMFFGKKATDSTKQRVTHVAIWLGNDQGEFIHASGRVKLGSVDPVSKYYDEFNTNRYLGSRRYLGQKDKAIIDLKLLDVQTRIKS